MTNIFTPLRLTLNYAWNMWGEGKLGPPEK